VAVTALLALPLSMSAAGAVHRLNAIIAAVTLLAMIVVAYRRPVRIGPHRHANVTTAAEVAAVLLLPGPLAVLVVGLGTWWGEAAMRPAFVQRLFNVSVAVLRGVAGVAVFALVVRAGDQALIMPVAALLAALAMYISATLLVLGIAAVQLRDNPIPRMWASQRETAIAELALIVTGIMAALAGMQAVWALPLLVAPALIAQRALRDGVALQAQTRLALEELADVVDMRDHYTYEHSRRVSELSRAVARQLGLPRAEVEDVAAAARLHDVGKIGIKSSVLLKPGRLSDREWLEMRTHPEVGARLISQFPSFARGRDLVLSHHEKYDGSGYPRRLKGEQIPLGARIIAVADAWDAMTSNRAYRNAVDLDAVLAEMERCRGTQFDPAVLDAFFAVLKARPDLARLHTEETQDVDIPLAQPEAPPSAA
jgi:HD-GYP domain-containing protein (c-di-GMP phosphodiesterase class II)